MKGVDMGNSTGHLWTVLQIPTDAMVSSLDQKKVNQIDNRLGVAFPNWNQSG